MVLQNFGETYPASHDADQAINIKAEEVSDSEKEEEDEDPVPITFKEIKAEREVSSVSLCAHCEAGVTDMHKCHLSF
jgi:hypothetical protein